MSMSLAQFAQHEITMLAKFSAYWETMHKKDPEMYPMAFPEGDEGGWDEQYRAFCETYQEDTSNAT